MVMDLHSWVPMDGLCTSTKCIVRSNFISSLGSETSNPRLKQSATSAITPKLSGCLAACCVQFLARVRVQPGFAISIANVRFLSSHP